MRNVSVKFVEEIKFLCSITFFSENCVVYEIRGNNGSARQATDENKILHMRSTCRINKDRTEYL